MAVILVGVERVIQKGQIAGNVDATCGNQREKTGKVPRIVKELPPKRADFSFGDLVYWHLFVYGTTAKGDPAAKIGRPWDLGGFCKLIGITQKTLRNWVGDKHLPDDTVDLETELFGSNPVFDDWRLELQQALRATRARKARDKMQGAKIVGASNLPVSSDPSSDEPSGRGAADQNLPMRFGTDVAVTNANEPEQGDGPDDEIWHVPASWTSDPIDTSGEVAIIEPEILHATGTRRRIRRAPVLVAGVALLLGIYGWARTSPSSTSDAPVVRGPDKPQPPKKADEANDNAARQKAAQEEQDRQEAERKRAASNTTKEAQPSEAEKRVAAEKRVQEQTIAALKTAHDAETKAAEQDAIRRDREQQAAASAQRDREWNARQIAGMGYRALENTSVTGSSIGQVLAETETDCALACLRDKCDGYAYKKDEPLIAGRKGRACYRYKEPLTFFAHSSYTAGKRTVDAATGEKIAETQIVPADAPVQVAQNVAPAVAGGSADGVTQCPSGPVKVTGFNLTCDATLGGGTTLGSAQLSYTVANINECAAKCRPIQRCVGFTFNAADPPGRQACMIFGPTPEKRTSGGWISATRP